MTTASMPTYLVSVMSKASQAPATLHIPAVDEAEAVSKAEAADWVVVAVAKPLAKSAAGPVTAWTIAKGILIAVGVIFVLVAIIAAAASH